jgi:hypothetical protein
MGGNPDYTRWAARRFPLHHRDVLRVPRCKGKCLTDHLFLLNGSMP